MKTQMLKPALVASAALGAAFLTGCASMDRGYSQGQGNTAASALAFMPLTDTRELVKWSNDPLLSSSLRSIDTYNFTVGERRYQGRAEMIQSGSMDSSSLDHEAIGAGPGYQSESGSYRVIQHRPNSVR